jgi:hypothetical protein
MPDQSGAGINKSGFPLAQSGGKVTPHGQRFATNRKRAVPAKSGAGALPMPAERAYSYALPEGVEAVPGQIVQVPLGPRLVAGVVWDGEADAGQSGQAARNHPGVRLPAAHRADAPVHRLGCGYTLSPPGLVARMALRAPAAFDPEPLIEALQAHRSAARAIDGGARTGARPGGLTGWPGPRAGLPMRRA